VKSYPLRGQFLGFSIPRQLLTELETRLQDVSTPCPPQVFTEREVRPDAGSGTPCLPQVFAEEAELVIRRPLKRTYAQASK